MARRSGSSETRRWRVAGRSYPQNLKLPNIAKTPAATRSAATVGHQSVLKVALEGFIEQLSDWSMALH